MNSKLKDAHMDALFNAVLSLNTLEECYNFYEDFFRSLLTCTQRIALCYHRGGEYYDYK